MLDFPKMNTKVQFVSSYDEIKAQAKAAAVSAGSLSVEDGDQGDSSIGLEKKYRIDTETVK